MSMARSVMLKGSFAAPRISTIVLLWSLASCQISDPPEAIILQEDLSDYQHRLEKGIQVVDDVEQRLDDLVDTLRALDVG